MNFTLTPGVYAALNLLSKATRSKVLEAAFAFVICGIRPTNLPKNLLVMFMMVVDSASEGKLTYTPDQPADAQPVEEDAGQEEKKSEVPELEVVHEENKPERESRKSPAQGAARRMRDYEMALTPGFTKVKGLRRRIKNRGSYANGQSE